MINALRLCQLICGSHRSGGRQFDGRGLSACPSLPFISAARAVSSREHLVIRREEYVAGTREKPEVGVFTQTHSSRPPVPWGRITPGERVWMKWSGGPVVAKAVVDGFRQIENCSPEGLRLTTTGYKLHDVSDYWARLPERFFGLTIYLGREEWLDQPFMPAGRSRGESWFVMVDDQERRRWLATMSEQTVEAPRRSAGRGTRTVSLTLRFHVLRRDGFRCSYCGRTPPDVTLHVDHIVPFSAGGSTTFDNLRASCVECNLGKGASRLEA